MRVTAVRVLAFPALFAASAAAVHSAEPKAVRPAAGADLAAWTGTVDRMLRDGDLRVRQIREDTLIEGREHARLAQFYKGVPVFGGELAVQSENGRVLSVFGTLYEGIDLDTRPALSADQAERIVERLGFAAFGSQGGPELTVLPLEDAHVLAYRLRARAVSGLAIKMLFIDARSGEVALEYDDLKTQAVGSGTGVLGDRKKVSTRQEGSGFVADDKLRPPLLATYDFKGDVLRLLSVDLFRLPTSDLASDADNEWTDGANVDAHAYGGYTYDYYFKRFGRRGLDNANIPMRSITHPVRREDYALNLARFGPGIRVFYDNAAYLGDGFMLYGEGLPVGITSFGQAWDFTAGAIDIVAHELTHGVTDYSSRLIYRNESGALNEAFSDIMGTAVEFYFQPPGSGRMQADYLIGEDVAVPGGVRSMRSPASFGDPDHYSIRYLGPLDNGGVHINSGIANHAYYLAIEGGTNRVSGLAVQGVGAANREQIERVFYRAFTALLTPSAGFAQARAATIQAARELYGVGSGPERALTQAWTAVGVN
jgi:thermolysin